VVPSEENKDRSERQTKRVSHGNLVSSSTGDKCIFGDQFAENQSRIGRDGWRGFDLIEKRIPRVDSDSNLSEIKMCLLLHRYASYRVSQRCTLIFGSSI
jgi:hypothetical protein